MICLDGKSAVRIEKGVELNLLTCSPRKALEQ